MSISGSIVGYENNNEVNKKRNSITSRSKLFTNFRNHNHQTANSMGKHCPPSSLNSSISNSVITTASSGICNSHHHNHHHQHHQQQPQQPHMQHQQHQMNSKRKHTKYSNMHPDLDQSNNLHLNSLWSIWYGVLLTLFQGYLAVHGAYRFLGCSLIQWKIEPVAELNLQIVLSGVVFILLPLFFTSAVFKVGNLANDGIKLAAGGSKERHCSMQPHDGLEEEAHGGTLRALWTHGGPTAAFVHIVIAMCLLMPRLLLEARITENGLLPKENIWQTELDFIAVSRRNLVVMSVMTSPYQNISNIEDEDYYNDTMFTAIDGNSIETGHSNSFLEITNDNKLEKQTKKTNFELPDLVSRETTSMEDHRNYDDERKAANNANLNQIVGRVKVEEIDSNELPATKVSSTTTTTTRGTTTSTTTATTTTTTLPGYITTQEMEKNFDDKPFDKFGLQSKGNSVEDSLATISNDRTTTTPTVGTTTATTSTVKSTTKSTTTAAATTSTSSTSTQTAAATSSTTGSTITFTATQQEIIQPNRTHHHHHQHQHHGKSNRKHNRQHRQRLQNHRRHHGLTTTTASSLASGGRSDEYRSIRFDDDRSERINAGSISKTMDLNRLDDIDLSLIGSVGKSRIPANSASAEDEVDYGRRALYTKTTSTISTTTRDSNIHIVKPEMLPEIIPSTPVASNSKIIEIKTKVKKLVKRMADDELQVEIEPEYLIGDVPNNSNDSDAANTDVETEDLSSAPTAAEYTASPPDDTNIASIVANNDNSGAVANGGGLVRLDGFAGMLQIFFGIEKPIDVNVFTHPPSAEFINLMFALLVWCCRYPAVFWSTTKSFATVFSIQMIASALDIIFSYVGISSLYKLQVYSEAMPVQNTGLILNGVVTLALFLLSTILLISSSMIMYLYGHGRLAAKMRDRSLITMKSSETWIYFAHCASLCYVLALAVVKAPLLNDLSATYRSNLHCTTFFSALISVVHILLWIVIWLGLTAKRRWTFKLPPVDTYGIGKASTQPLLMPNRGSQPSSGGGSSILDQQRQHESQQQQQQQKGVISNASSVDAVEDIYWPKLTPSSPKLKVTFNEVTSTSDDVLLIGDHEQNIGKRDSPRGTSVCFTSAAGEIDDGDYATLRSATATTVIGIGIGGALGGGCGGGGGGASVAGSSSIGGTSNGGGTTPSASSVIIGNCVKILHLSEYDELPPPPPLLTTAPSNVAFGIGLSSDYANCSIIDGSDTTSEEGKLLACVRDDSVTYASTRDLEPTPPPPPPPLPQHASDTMSNVPPPRPLPPMQPIGKAPQAMPEIMQLSSSPEHLVSPLAPVTVTVHTNEAHIASSSTPRCLRRADSGVPNEALTPRSDTTSTTESTTSPPERAPSESSSGVHSGEERDIEVVIRPRIACKPPPKPPQPVIQEEPYGRSTNMKMSSFITDGANSNNNSRFASNSSTLPLQRTVPEQKFDYSHCSTMPLPVGCHSQQVGSGGGGYSTSSAASMHSSHYSHFKPQMYANSAVAMAGANAAKYQQQLQQQQQQQQQLQQQQQQQQQQLQQQLPYGMHTTLPNGVRYSNPHFLRRLPHVTMSAQESPYGHLGLGAGHHTFSKLLHDPLQHHGLASTTIPEDRDSANYSMSSDQDCGLYATANHMN